jgi:hypothetical protein
MTCAVNSAKKAIIVSGGLNVAVSASTSIQIQIGAITNPIT